MEALVILCALAIGAVLLFRFMDGRDERGAIRSSTSENGNLTMQRGQKRVTIFESDGGWKYCLAHVNDDVEPYFSGVYETEVAAKGDGIAHMNGHVPAQIREAAVLKRKEVEGDIGMMGRGNDELRAYLDSELKPGVTPLRKAEKMARHQQREGARVLSRLLERMDGDEAAGLLNLDTVAWYRGRTNETKIHVATAEALAQEVAARIETEQAKKKRSGS